MSIIRVKFDGNSTEYSYFCDYRVAEGDRVIVDSPSTGYTAVTVTSTTSKGAAKKATKEVVCTINAGRYEQRKAAMERIEEISIELERKRRQRVRDMEIATLLKDDVAAMEMLKEQETLTKYL